MWQMLFLWKPYTTREWELSEVPWPYNVRARQTFGDHLPEAHHFKDKETKPGGTGLVVKSTQAPKLGALTLNP